MSRSRREPNLIPQVSERQSVVTKQFRPSLGAVMLVATLLVLVGCGSEQGSSSEEAPEESSSSAPEPAESQPLEEEPAGEVVEVGNEPEGVAADPVTGLLAVGLRDPGQLALVD